MTRLPKTMNVAGVMSGTSADGVDVALVRIAPERDEGGVPRLKVLGHLEFRYARAVRETVLRAMDAGEKTSVPELARLHWRLGEVYADAVEKTTQHFGVKIGLVGMHGQTIYHQAQPESYLGRPVRATWQIGEAAAVAERMRVPVVSDFRPADLAAGGQGAPLVPMLDFCVFDSNIKNRVLLNLGGIANFTVIPAGGAIGDVLAFDTGPANMVIDEVTRLVFGKSFDRGGRLAARGHVIPSVIEVMMRERYFAGRPPKSCGREQFGRSFAERLQDLCVAVGGSKVDVIATATELTISSVIDAYRRFCEPHLDPLMRGQRAPLARSTEVVVAGGGVRNDFLMRRLHEEFAAAGVRVLPIEKFGLAAQAKEAVAFALLGWLSWHGRSGNVPRATGARRDVVLGKVTC